MKQKGFTLVELLGVIIILSILVVIVFPIVNSIVTQSKDTVYQQQINKILSSAYDFSLKNINYFPENNKNYITLGQLKSEGLIDVDIKNPNTNEIFPDNLVISINNVGSEYKNNNNNSILKGDYLYTVEVEKLENPNLKELIPTITLKIDEEEWLPNSNGDYIKTLNLNESLDKINYKATSKSGVDITKKVKKIILKNNKSVENVDSSTSGIYKINYTVVDDAGYADTLILNIIIADTTPPILSFPKETIISKDVKNYDLVDKVTCEDNSGFCDIEFIGTIDYGVIGNYIIEYSAKDPSGNTITSKRVIEIE